MRYNIFVMNLLVPINDQLVDLCEDHIVLTPNDRLAKEFRNSYDQYQIGKGLTAWTSPVVRSLNNHLRSIFFYGHNDENQNLSVVDNRALFTQLYSIIPESQRSLINQAIEAIHLIRRYEVDLEQYREISYRCGTLMSWYEALSASNGTEQILESQLATYLTHNELETNRLLLYQFEHLTPSEKRYLENCSTKSSIVLVNSDNLIKELPQASKVNNETKREPPKKSLLRCDNLNQELAGAVKWATEVKKTKPDSTIGIVVPNLSTHYSQVSRQIAVTLNSFQGSHTEQFNISSGQPLNKHPLWKHALTYLRSYYRDLKPYEYENLATSSFFDSNYIAERFGTTMSASKNNNNPAHESKRLSGNELPNLNENAQLNTQPKLLKTWVEDLLTHLNDIGWPVVDSIQTFGYQAYQAIKQELLFLKSLGTNEPLTLDEALELIDSYLNTITHAPERKAQDIQVLGLIESLGLHFSHLWICEMDSENFPSRCSANVFLPQSTKSKYKMPQATQQEELGFAKSLLKSWHQQSSNLVFSYSCRKGDAEITPSPLILEAPETPIELNLTNLNPDFKSQRIDLISTLDERGSRYTGTSIRGGVRMLKDQINCGFKSFAINRLGLEASETPSDLPGPLEKGIVVHEALARLFAKRHSKQAMESVSKEETEATTKLMVERYFKKAPNLYKDSEVQRISNLIKTWIAFEASRQPFHVISLEKPFRLELAGIEFSLRADRIDKVGEDLILIDYKTGKVNLSQARSDNLRDPQLAAYALAISGLKGTFFAQLDEEKPKLSGFSTNDNLDAKFKSVTGITFDNELEKWSIQLEQTAHDFVEGKANISPTQGYCLNCHLSGFCRIQ